MTNPNRKIPLLQISTAAGSDPDVIEALDDCDEVYVDWPQIVEPCPKSPRGQCEYASWFFNHARCIHCGGGDGVL